MKRNINVYKEVFNITVNGAIAYFALVLTDKYIDINSDYNFFVKILIVVVLVSSIGYCIYKIFKKYNDRKKDI